MGIAVPVGLVIIAATVLLLCVIHKKRTKLSGKIIVLICRLSIK